MIYVVDQNIMRSGALRSLVELELDSSFVIPDAALEEMTKNEKWEETIRGSFRTLEPVLDRVYFSEGLGTILKRELSSRRPVHQTELLPSDITEGARELVTAILSGNSLPNDWRRWVNDCRTEAQAERRSGEDLRSSMLARVEQFKSLNGRDLTNELRGGRISAEARLGLLKLRAEDIAREFLGLEPSEMKTFEPTQFMTIRYLYAILWYQEDWLRAGGLENAKPKKLANDEFDMEYVLVASFCDKLLTADQRAARCDEDLRKVISSNDLSQALYAHAVATGRLHSNEVTSSAPYEETILPPRNDRG